MATVTEASLQHPAIKSEQTSEPHPRDITPKHVFDAYHNDRRAFVKKLGLAGMGAAAMSALPRRAFADPTKLTTVSTPFSAPYPTTPQQMAYGYNNFYEFGTGKDDPAKNAHTLVTYPWSIQFEGLVKKPQTINIGDLLHYKPMQQRIYRFRCVEAWSMVIPWDGYPLSEIINYVQPLPTAKFIKFISYENSKQQELPDGFNWPYKEGLRMDEAMNPLTLLTFGSYGETLANQQGAPVRVIVPWKYGFKSAKSIVKMRFVDKMPETTWNDLAPDEYGFYSNVNPAVDHPRWSQARERLLDANTLFPKYVPTLPFNGYGDQVAGMYTGMDLRKNF
jgi:sulfoxide reductase catalytic subunit YedY